MRSDRAFLEDIIEAIARIEKYASKGRAAFDTDELIQNWMVHHIQIIGEATGKISDALKAQHPEVPWAVIKAMRNVLVHFYFGINLEKVWKTVVEDLPVLKAQINAVVLTMPAPEALSSAAPPAEVRDKEPNP
ncbi:MAG TPA: DUF86 domain-containing protein [Planctomycetota bacterium]|jgi:uncharacterized protein with HEPN domain